MLARSQSNSISPWRSITHFKYTYVVCINQISGSVKDGNQAALVTQQNLGGRSDYQRAAMALSLNRIVSRDAAERRRLEGLALMVWRDDRRILDCYVTSWSWRFQLRTSQRNAICFEADFKVSKLRWWRVRQ